MTRENGKESPFSYFRRRKKSWRFFFFTHDGNFVRKMHWRVKTPSEGKSHFIYLLSNMSASLLLCSNFDIPVLLTCFLLVYHLCYFHFYPFFSLFWIFMFIFLWKCGERATDLVFIFPWEVCCININKRKCWAQSPWSALLEYFMLFGWTTYFHVLSLIFSGWWHFLDVFRPKNEIKCYLVMFILDIFLTPLH